MTDDDKLICIICYLLQADNWDKFWPSEGHFLTLSIPHSGGHYLSGAKSWSV